MTRRGIFRTKGALGIMAAAGLAVVVSATPFELEAACAPDPVTSGGTVTCTGTDSNGVGTGAETNVRVDILAGASVSSSGEGNYAIDLASGAVVTNNGTIAGPFAMNVGIHSSVTNLADIIIELGEDALGGGIFAGDGSVVLNDGLIGISGPDAVPMGLYIESAGSVTNAGEIEITGRAGRGISAGHGNLITNTGSISVTGNETSPMAEGITMYTDNQIDNSGDITVTVLNPDGMAYGINELNSRNSIDNSGTIEVTSAGGAIGILLNGLDEVVNTGDIIVGAETGDARGISALGGYSLMNYGLIEATGDERAFGVVVNTPSRFENHGAIKATADTSYGVLITGNGNLVPVLLVNTGNIQAQTAIRGTSAGFLTSPVHLTIQNSGSITGDLVLDGMSNRVTNQTGGEIFGSIQLGGGPNTVVNQSGALVFAQGVAISAVDGNIVTNNGNISSNVAGTAIRLEDNNDVLNAGVINATATGAVAIAVVTGNGSDLNGDGYAGITNTGAINAGAIGISALQFGKITNTGTIDAEGTGIQASNDLLVRNTGTISGDNVGVHVGAGNDLLNLGTIESETVGIDAYHENKNDLDGDGNSGVVNDGAVVSLGDGINVRADNTVVNKDSINAGRDGIAVVAHTPTASAQTNRITNTGTITAQRDAISIAQGAATVVNSGTLSGERAIKGGAGVESITNSGRIDGDVVLGGGNDSLDLRDQSFIAGAIDGGAGTDIITMRGTGVIVGSITGIETMTLTEGVVALEITGSSAVANTRIEGGALLLGGTLDTDLTIREDGGLQAAATIIGNVENAGNVSPGNFVGTLNVDGNYHQTATGDLLIQMGTTAADKLAITGAAVLDGTLTTALQGSDLAALEGRSYSVLTAASITGAFDHTGVVEQGFWTVNVIQTGTAVNVTILDVDLTIGATASFTGALAHALAAAAPEADPSGGIEFDGGGAPPLDVVEEDDGAQDQQSASLSYDSLGDWENSAASFVSGWSDMGGRTPAAAMPKTGTGEFEGTTRGELTEAASPEAFVVEGDVLLTADFASGLVNADFTGMEKIDSRGVTSAWVDFRARMSIADGTSEFVGTAGTEDGVWNGEAKGGFFGDEDGIPGHAAGLWSMSSALGRALGGFTAKRQ